jgi:hypothetical protein
MRNRIINGAMVIDQRNAGASVGATSSAPYTLDRYYAYATNSSKFTVQQNAGSVTPPAGFRNYLGITSSAATTPGATDSYTLGQSIEGYNVADLSWGTSNAKPITLSFQIYSSLTGTFGGVVKNSDSSRSYPFTYAISSANTWTSISITIAGDTSGTWLTTNGAGIQLVFGMGVGSTYSGTAGAWASANYNTASGVTNVVGTNGATWYITGLQLEAGTTASPFEYRQFGLEFMLCQRYYERSYDYGTNTYSGEIMKGIASFGTPFTSAYASTNQMDAFMKLFLVTKRASPTMTGYSLTDGVAGKWRRYYTGVSPADDQNVTFSNISTTGAEVIVASGGNCNIALGHWVANAEL